MGSLKPVQLAMPTLSRCLATNTAPQRRGIGCGSIVLSAPPQCLCKQDSGRTSKYSTAANQSCTISLSRSVHHVHSVDFTVESTTTRLKSTTAVCSTSNCYSSAFDHCPTSLDHNQGVINKPTATQATRGQARRARARAQCMLCVRARTR
eukprot:scpid73476/ scgid12096/ 